MSGAIPNCQLPCRRRTDENANKIRAQDSPPTCSFPLEDEPVKPGGPLVLGYIVISLERAHRQAEEYGHRYELEVAFLCAHAMLHLLGYDHERGEEADLDMQRRQRRILESIGLGETAGA